jgi:hypothetical protein
MTTESLSNGDSSNNESAPRPVEKPEDNKVPASAVEEIKRQWPLG